MEIFKGKKPIVDNLVKFIEESAMGTFISHDTIKDITGIDKKLQPQLMSTIIGLVRNRLLSETNHTPIRFISSIKGEGYIVTLPRDFSNQGEKWKRKSTNAIKKSDKILSVGMQYLPSLSTTEQHKLLTESAKVKVIKFIHKNVESKETKKVLESSISQKRLIDNMLIDSNIINFVLNNASKDSKDEDKSQY